MITQERLKELLHYNPGTGTVTNLTNRGRRADVGGRAGSLNSVTRYIIITLDKNREFAHRLAFLYMTGVMPERHTDHINGIRHDNRWCNLRAVTPLINHKNQKRRRHNKSGVNGVCWLKKLDRWQVQIRVNYKAVHIGHFIDFDEAVQARRQADIDHGFHDNHGRG